MPVVVIFLGGLLGLAVAGFPSRRHDAPLTVRSSPTTTVAVAVATVPESTTTPRATTTQTSLRAPADVRVMAINASSVAGSAARVGARIKSLGWSVLPPGADRKVQDTSVVMYRAGYDGEARSLASALGLDPAGIAAVDAVVTAAGDTDLAVVIGDDLAKRTN